MVNRNDLRHLPTHELLPAIFATLLCVVVAAVVVAGPVLLKLWMWSE